MDDSLNRHAKILIVDDVLLNIQLQRTFLEPCGYTILEARNGEAGLEMARKELPDLILLDVMMPKMNGFSVCQFLKNDEKTRFIPIIMVTALNELEDKIKGIEAGADDFIHKPFNKLELMARVKSLLRLKQLHDQLQEKIHELEDAQAQLRELAITDGLTALYNYRYFHDTLIQELERARRHNLKASVVILDIDYFKHYNDYNGHPAGNEVLSTIARLLKANIRKNDTAARYGGEEFSVVLVETGKEAATLVAHKIKDLVEAYAFGNEEHQPAGKLTISVGVATYPDDCQDLDELVKCADRRLYKAKKNGRNLVVAE